MEKAGMILGGFALSSGIGATVLVMSNLIVWAVITAWVGSVMAFFGFSLIVFALARKQEEEKAQRNAPRVHSKTDLRAPNGQFAVSG